MTRNYIDPQTQKQRDRLMSMLNSLKAAGLKTYICKDSTEAYGMVTDGNDFINLSGAAYGYGITVSFDYRPTIKCGTGCCLGDSLLGITKDITIDDFRNWVMEGRSLARKYGAVLYSDVTGPYVGEKDTPLEKYKRISGCFNLYKEY